MRDPYLDVVSQHWSLIVMLYEQYASEKPVMLFDIQEQRIYALPYPEYRAELSKRSQASLKKQYERALANNEIVVFVRDNEEEKLVSYSQPLPDRSIEEGRLEEQKKATTRAAKRRRDGVT